MRLRNLALLLLVLPTVAFAGQGDVIPESALDANNPDDMWKQLENLPPRRSWDMGVDVSFGPITYWRAYQPPWVGFGGRFVYGSHVGEARQHRIGVGIGASIDGPAPEFFTTGIEPQVCWDVVVSKLDIGASLGPTLLLHGHQTLTGEEMAFGLTPQASVRIGYSKPWSRVTRRLFVVAEPKFRIISDRLAWNAAIMVGAGQGK
jgi:hypothetical protein